jgi:2-isopropylmalate synthase
MSFKANRVAIFDTTLRDGEQAPGFSLEVPAKVQMARALDALGVDIIEAGFPIASPTDADAVTHIAREVRRPVIAALARCRPQDIDEAARALAPAERRRIHTFLATSDLHIERKLRISRDACFDAIVDGVRRARNFTDDVEFSAEDATRSARDFLCRVVEAAITSGATTINLPDTVGYGTPDETAEFFADIIRSVPNSDKAVFSAHCHDDLGLAVANSLAAIQGGVRQVECTINGIGERAGNAALEEIVMALRVRNDRMPFETAIQSPLLFETSQLLARLADEPVQANKAIVGRNAFAHESGIHQDGVLKHAQTFEIMTPESVGLKESSLVMGKHSGRHAFREKLKELGYELGDNAFEDAFVRFKALADRKKHVYDEDLEALVDQEIASAHDRIKVVALTVIAGTGGPQRATLTLDVDGRQQTHESTGDGPVDATFRAIKAIVPHEARMPLYQVSAVTEGTDAQAEVAVRLEADGKTVTGRGSDTDTLVASARAYVSALNKLLAREARRKPETMLAS